MIGELRERLPGVVAEHDPTRLSGSRTSGCRWSCTRRRAADPDAAIEACRGPVGRLADELGLEAHDGTGVLEIRLPGYDKGSRAAAAGRSLRPAGGAVRRRRPRRPARVRRDPASCAARAAPRGASACVVRGGPGTGRGRRPARRRPGRRASPLLRGCAADGSLSSSASSCAWNHCAGGSRDRGRPHPLGALGPLVGRHQQRRVQRLGRRRDVERVDLQRVLAEHLGRTGLARQHDRRLVLGQHQALQHDQVHPVAHRVDEQHVAAAQHRQRRRVVVGDLEEQRRPVVGAELVVDVVGEPGDRRGVLAIGGQVLARRVVVDRVHDPAAPLRMRCAAVRGRRAARARRSSTARCGRPGRSACGRRRSRSSTRSSLSTSRRQARLCSSSGSVPSGNTWTPSGSRPDHRAAGVAEQVGPALGVEAR